MVGRFYTTPRSSLAPPRPDGSAIGALQETWNLQSTLLLWSSQIFRPQDTRKGQDMIQEDTLDYSRAYTMGSSKVLIQDPCPSHLPDM